MLLSRRRVLVGGLTIAAAGAVAGRANESALAAPATTLEEQIRELEARYNAFIGLYGVNLQSGFSLKNRADEAFALCSTFKTYAAARVLQLVAQGELSLDQRVFVKPEGILPNSPVTGEHVGQEMTLAELSQAALQRSDNLAANLLLETLGGPESITAFARSIGDDRTRLDRWEIGLNSAIQGTPATPARRARWRPATVICWPETLYRLPSVKRSTAGCAQIRRRACVRVFRRSGPRQTRPAAATTRPPTIPVSRTGPTVPGCC